jgi:aspartate/methionine/tyrosine aminotransferase
MAYQPVPFDKTVVQSIVQDFGYDIGTASIREMNRVINTIEEKLGVSYIRMEFGIPSLPVNELALEAEIAALKEKHLANVYAPFDGVPVLKQAAKKFCKAFMDLDVPEHCCIPTNGAMQGGFVSIGIAGRRFEDRDTILFLDPGFPVNKMQANVWGLKTESIDFYDFRGEQLLSKLEERFKTGSISSIMYSTPNNPAWIVLKPEELEGIGKLCAKYHVIAIEDLAYFAMDFRVDYGNPYQPPYQPTIASYTDQYILLISSSKMFSYAGQRIAVAILSPELFKTEAPPLKQYYGSSNLGHAFVHGGMYANTACVAESPQYGLAALMEAAVDGTYRFTEPVKEYARRAKEMKKAFLNNGFYLVYDNDLGEPLADGFYFTVAYPGMDGGPLLENLIYYGVSAISLSSTGSTRTEGIRACTSLTTMEQIPELAHRLESFHRDLG